MQAICLLLEAYCRLCCWLFQQVVCTLTIHLEAAELDGVDVCAVARSEAEEPVNGSGHNSAAAVQHLAKLLKQALVLK